jgi:hypothetical protein
MISKNIAIEKIEKAFPEIADELHDEIIEGLIHLQIAEFSHLAQLFIDHSERDAFGAICRLFIELYEQGESDLVNALNVSFLEHLNFKDGKVNRRWAYQEMPAKMRKAYDDMEKYNAKIHGRR